MATDWRTQTEKDCDRVLYSSWFRRLAGVTQVVAVRETQLFHNRLTHTIKVAQLARRLARDLELESPELAQLVLGERLRWEQVQRRRARLVEQPLERP